MKETAEARHLYTNLLNKLTHPMSAKTSEIMTKSDTKDQRSLLSRTDY